MSAVRRQQEFSYDFSGAKPQEPTYTEPQKEVTAYADLFFETYNSDAPTAPSYADVQSPDLDFSFAKPHVVSSYDYTTYVLETEGSEQEETFSETKPAPRKKASSERFTKWLGEKKVWQQIEAGAKQQEQTAARRQDERYVLVEDFGYGGQERYDLGLYETKSPHLSVESLLDSDYDLIRPSLTDGNLAVMPTPINDDALLNRLKAQELIDEKEREQRQAALKEDESRLSIKRLYKALGIERAKKLAISFAAMLTLGAGFIGLMGRQAQIVEANFDLANKRKEIRQLSAANQENYESLMKANDLNELKDQALAQLGLREASQSQRIRIYLPEADRSVLYNADGEVTEDATIADDYLNYNELEKYFDGVKGMYD